MSVQYSGEKITFADGSTVASGWSGFKNRIINGAMMIDQRNAGASVTIPSTVGQYTLDRWWVQSVGASKFSVQQNAGSVTLPVGFTNYLGITSLAATSASSTDYYGLFQQIEGFNTADLSWGTANAKTITLSFQVYSSLTGTFSGSLRNAANNRSYPFTYTISSANTWTSITVTIAGDTSGTWNTTNSTGIGVVFDIGTGSNYRSTAGSWQGGNYYGVTSAVSVLGTNGATFYITGVQLEKGSTATSFDYRPYGTELALCQRYYYQLDTTTGGSFTWGSGVNTGSDSLFVVQHPVNMRASPTAGINGTFTIYNGATSGARTSFSSTNVGTVKGRLLFSQVGSAGNAVWSDFGTSLTFSSEL